MASHPPEHLLTWIALCVSALTVGSGATLTLLAQWRLQQSLWRSLFHVGLMSLFFIGLLVVIDALIGHSGSGLL